MLKYEQDFFHNGGGDARPLRSWSDFSSLQYIGGVDTHPLQIVATVWMKSLNNFSGALNLLHHYKINVDHLLAF